MQEEWVWCKLRDSLQALIEYLSLNAIRLSFSNLSIHAILRFILYVNKNVHVSIVAEHQNNGVNPTFKPFE